jgi:apolipoprotein N-acyltransferase
MALIVIVTLAAIFNLAHPEPPATPSGWRGMDTRFGGLGFGGTLGTEEFAAARQIQRQTGLDARIVVFPETVVPAWSQATDVLWQRFVYRLADQGKTIIVGARFPRGSGIENGLVIRGAEHGSFLQRIPVPLGMWLPSRSESAAMRPFGPATIRIAGVTVAPLICYEQFLTWPILTAALQHPMVLLAPSNLFWARGTRLRARQRALVRAWSRLFDVGVIAAVNE